MAPGFETAGKVALPLSVAVDAIQLKQAFDQDGGGIGTHTELTAAGVAGSWAGAEVGAEAGATIGSVIPGVGTAAGALVGGVVGGVLGGDKAGRAIFDGIKSLF